MICFPKDGPPGLGEAIIVLGNYDLPQPETMDERDDMLVLRWQNNRICMVFDGSFEGSLSYRKIGSGIRVSIDFFISGPPPKEFFELFGLDIPS